MFSLYVFETECDCMFSSLLCILGDEFWMRRKSISYCLYCFSSVTFCLLHDANDTIVKSSFFLLQFHSRRASICLLNIRLHKAWHGVDFTYAYRITLHKRTRELIQCCVAIWLWILYAIKKWFVSTNWLVVSEMIFNCSTQMWRSYLFLWTGVAMNATNSNIPLDELLCTFSLFFLSVCVCVCLLEIPESH